MKILVTAKRVTDPYSKITLKKDGSGLDLDNVDFKMNPFCEIAIEEALRIAEDADDPEIIVIAIGDDEATKEVRTGLAMGADRGILVEHDEDELDSDLVARILVKICQDEEPDLVILGKQATDGDSNQVGQLMAEYLGWPQATFAYKVSVNDDYDGADVMREVDGGVETVRLSFPAVITTDLRLNEPRYASLPGIMKAKRKPLDVFDLEDLEIDDELKVETVGFEMPPERQAGIIIGDVDELMDKLANEAKVI
ncbi:MAG: electron transfer flavoprotein subunit beta/FixA family protein [Myxococcota bacterium]|nr:electron transfer flavoprotein subunit beta/FixA family protein [Myxococcota bacterium]